MSTASYYRKGRGHSVRGQQARDAGAVPWSKLPSALRRSLTSEQADQLRITDEWHHAGKFAAQVPVYYREQVEAFWAVVDAADIAVPALLHAVERAVFDADPVIRSRAAVWYDAVAAAEAVRERVADDD